MSRFKKIIIIVLLVILLAGSILTAVFSTRITSTPAPMNNQQETAPQQNQNPPPSVSQFAEPVKDFQKRVTKKPFGIYSTPQNSPVQPEHFTGYHTGTDAEYTEVTDDVPVFAINDGTVTVARTASGYGGVTIIKTEINGATHSVLYGHIRPSSLPKIGQTVKKGEQIGLLGTGFSTETDGERRHLHLGILSDDRIDLRGYVQSKGELAGWLNSQDIIK